MTNILPQQQQQQPPYTNETMAQKGSELSKGPRAERTEPSLESAADLQAKKAKATGHPSVDLHTSDLRVSGPSAVSRTSASEASRVIGTRVRGDVDDDRPRKAARYGEEGRGGRARDVSVHPTPSGKSSAHGSTAPLSLLPTQRNTSRRGTTNLSVPASSYLTPTPGRSSNKPPGRLTLPIQRRQSGVSFSATDANLNDDLQPLHPAHQEPAAQSSKPLGSKSTATNRIYVPKQQIKPIYVDPAAAKASKTSKGKATAEPVKPISPPTQLAEPEEGDWKGVEWVERKIVRETVIEAAREAEEEEPVGKGKEQVARSKLVPLTIKLRLTGRIQGQIQCDAFNSRSDCGCSPRCKLIEAFRG